MAEGGEELAKSLTNLTGDIYKDTFQPSTQQLGKSLGAVMEWVLQKTYPLRLGNERRRLDFERNMKMLQQEFDRIPEHNIVEIANEIAIPLFEKISYTSNEYIARLFINLLAKSANSETLDQAHPVFISMVERMSVDEARIISYLNGKHKLHYIGMAQAYLTDLGKYMHIVFPENMSVYMSNLCGLNILKDERFNYSDPAGDDLAAYESIYSQHAQLQEIVLQSQQGGEPISHRMMRSFFVVTQLGKLFIKACNSIEK